MKAVRLLESFMRACLCERFDVDGRTRDLEEGCRCAAGSQLLMKPCSCSEGRFLVRGDCTISPNGAVFECIAWKACLNGSRDDVWCCWVHWWSEKWIRCSYPCRQVWWGPSTHLFVRNTRAVRKKWAHFLRPSYLTPYLNSVGRYDSFQSDITLISWQEGRIRYSDWSVTLSIGRCFPS